MRVAALAAALVIAAGCAGGSHAAQLHRHYFLVGKRECARLYRVLAIHPTKPPGVTMWTGVTLTAVRVGTRGVPKPYRRDLVAGCDAAG